MANKKICLLITILLTALFLFGATDVNSTYAYSININLDTNQIISGLPTQITDLINTGKQVWQNFTSGAGSFIKIPGTNGGTTLNGVLEDTNTWFVRITGISLTQIIKAVGGFVVWVLSLAIDLIKQGLSLVNK